jgi:hypothetical protein
MPGIKDTQGHEWLTRSIQDHPFLTTWKCVNCGRGTFTQDGCYSDDQPNLKDHCIIPDENSNQKS